MMAVITRAAPGQNEALGNILLMPPIVPHPHTLKMYNIQ